MTIDEGVDKAARAIDAMLVQRMDDYMLHLIATGLDADGVGEVIHEQQQRERVWRAETLIGIRTQLSLAAADPTW